MKEKIRKILLSLQKKPEKSTRRIHVTELFLPARALFILRKYYRKLNVPVEKLILVSFGIVWHKIFEEAFGGKSNYVAEKEFAYRFGKYTLLGRPDLYDRKRNILYDFKLSFSSLSSSLPESWIYQLNIYRTLWFPKAKMIIAKFTPHGLDFIEVPKIENEDVFEFLKTKIEQIDRMWKNGIPNCSEVENWNGKRCQYCFAEKLCRRLK